MRRADGPVLLLARPALGAIVDGAWAERKAELLGTLREHGTKVLVDTHGSRFRYDATLDVEKFRAHRRLPIACRSRGSR
ncbi:hypothetical protein BH23ACT2_BH23ACT2_09300 [soil metagenome]